MEKIDTGLHLSSVGIKAIPQKKAAEKERLFFSDVAFYQSDKVIGEKFSKPISKILTFDI